MKFAEIVAGMGEFSDLARHDTELKFWLPEPVDEALKEICARSGDSMSTMLRRFLTQHCYGLYATEVMTEAIPGLFRDEAPAALQFSRTAAGEQDGKVRLDTYWVPELGKNIAPIKIWIAARLRTDLEALAAHVGIKPSEYVREIVISRLLGHGTLPKRPQMLEAGPLPSAEDWCEGLEVPMRAVSRAEYAAHPEGKRNTEWRDAQPTES